MPSILAFKLHDCTCPSYMWETGDHICRLEWHNFSFPLHCLEFYVHKVYIYMYAVAIRLDYCHIGCIYHNTVTVEKRTSELFTRCFCSQINLSEYRSRVRKPVDQRKDSISSDQSSSPQPSTSTFLPPSFTPSHLTAASYSLLTPGATPPGTSLTGGVASSVPPPQFEPVSPDETDPSPMHITSDGTCTCIIHAVR